VPRVGIGPVRPGMTRDEARVALVAEPTPFSKAGLDASRADVFHAFGFQVFYTAEGLVDYIELSAGPHIEATLNGMAVFATPSEQVVAAVAALSPFDSSDPELGYSYVFPELDLAFWRPVLPESPDDPEGRYFATVGVGSEGYFRPRG